LIRNEVHSSDIAQYTIHSTQYTVQGTQTKYIVRRIQYTVNNTQYTNHSTQYTLHTFQSPKYKVHSTQYTVHCTEHTVQSTQYRVSSSENAVHSSQYAVHSAQYTVYSTQYTVHSTQKREHSTQPGGECYFFLLFTVIAFHSSHYLQTVYRNYTHQNCDEVRSPALSLLVEGRIRVAVMDAPSWIYPSLPRTADHPPQNFFMFLHHRGSQSQNKCLHLLVHFVNL